jgi:uncharacterized protein YgbK (DUF1537 family)
MKRLLAWYGDDFTGSTDVLEALSLQGIPAVLFLRQPGPETFAPFAGCEAFGLAGSSRGQSPEWMDEHLPAVFRWLATLGTPVVHYKVCSTFDSSPAVGSIGRAAEIGLAALGRTWAPIVAGAPPLRRYTAFGHLFAGAGEEVYRIDRHPTMSRHPVTPMLEADLRRHLAAQTELPVALVNCLEVRDAAALEAGRRAAPLVLIDVVDTAALEPVGALLWNAALADPLFVIGSSGVQYALATQWARPRPAAAAIPAADRLLVLSGSCSPGTAAQIGHARANGFETVALDAAALAGGGTDEAAERQAETALGAGRAVVLYTAEGPLTQRPELQAARLTLAAASGRLLARLLDRTGVRRVVVAGGDTSSAAGAELDIDALTFMASVAPGAPLCRAWSGNPRREGLEVVFKGGQCGKESFFSQVKGERG